MSISGLDKRAPSTIFGKGGPGRQVLQKTVEDLNIAFKANLPSVLSENREDLPREVATQNGTVYKIDAVLGRGGYGIVYRATSSLIGQHVALKIAGQTDCDTAKVLLEREGKILSLLKHPHIVGVVDYGITSDEGPYLAMEYIEGQTLDKILQFEHQLSPERAKNICLQVAEAMNYAHQCGYLHRDLKPANIMVSTVEGKDWVQVLDFGISDVERKPGDTSEISSRGSLCYMSPEQLLERPSSKRSDVYQLGLILFQCLTGNLPFR